MKTLNSKYLEFINFFSISYDQISTHTTDETESISQPMLVLVIAGRLAHDCVTLSYISVT